MCRTVTVLLNFIVIIGIDIFEDLISPVVAGQMFLADACQKRKNILDPIMVFCVQILMKPAETRDPRRKDGALNVIGSTADVLMKVNYIYFTTVHVFGSCLVALYHFLFMYSEKLTRLN